MSKLYLCFALRAAPAPALPEWRPRCPTPPPAPAASGPLPRGAGGGGRPSPAAAGPPRVAGGCNRGDAAGTGPGHPVGAAPHPRRCLRKPSTLAPPPPPPSPQARHRCPHWLPLPLSLPQTRFRGRCVVLGRHPGGCTLRGAPAASRGRTGPPGPRRPLGLAGAAPPPQAKPSRSQTSSPERSMKTFCRPWRLVLPGTKINARNRNLIT